MNGTSEAHAMHIAVGCYVVDALDAAEREAFEAHLVGCDSCAREVLEFTETAAELARLVAMTPPRDVRTATLANIALVRPLPPVVDEATEPAERSGRTLIEPTDRVPAADAGRPSRDLDAPRDELAVRRLARGARRNRLLVGLVAAAAVLAVALGGVVVTLSQQKDTNVASRSAAQRETELLSAPDAKVLTRTRDGASYSFVVSKARNQALLIAGDLPDPGPGKTFQLWTLQGRRATADATMPAGTGQQWFTGPIRDSTSLAVTVEPAGGSRQPTTPILAQVSI